jgi:hypothetical protein
MESQSYLKEQLLPVQNAFEGTLAKGIIYYGLKLYLTVYYSHSSPTVIIFCCLSQIKNLRKIGRKNQQKNKKVIQTN